MENKCSPHSTKDGDELKYYEFDTISAKINLLSVSDMMSVWVTEVSDQKRGVPIVKKLRQTVGELVIRISHRVAGRWWPGNGKYRRSISGHSFGA